MDRQKYDELHRSYMFDVPYVKLVNAGAVVAVSVGGDAA